MFWSELSSSGYTYAVDITHWLIYSAVLYHNSYRPLRITYSNALKYSLIPDCTWLYFRIWQHIICRFLNLMWKISFVTSCWLNYCIAIGWLSLLPSLCYCRGTVPSVDSCQQSVFKCMMEQLSKHLFCLGVKFKLGLFQCIHKHSAKQAFFCRKPLFFHKRPLDIIKNGVWCAMRASAILGPIVILRSQNHTDVTHFVTQTAEHSEQDMHCIQAFVGNGMISTELWPSHFPAMKLWDYYLWCMLKDKVCSNDPASGDDLQKAIRMQCAMYSVFVRFITCLWADRKCHLMWSERMQY
jgi:hypothetical protein